MFDTLSKAGKYLGQAAKMMIGVPDYDNYVEHIRQTHPEQTPMTYEEFFRERQDARYGGKGGRSVAKPPSQALSPPSTSRPVPEICPAAGLARNVTAAATSSACPYFPNAII